ncbi:sensor histidine kinase [Vibrio intestinalis]|uniref:sensor histidine kinase n=1 Tax=Vibrio intestinalis TaxID=2933291 RepID=UPI0021A573E9|nr:sensor histidine kinase [Vibrio intestinalis]
MTCLRTKLTGRWRNFVFTTFFCLFIAATTSAVWGGPVHVHILTSLGFGYGALISSLIFETAMPNASHRAEIMVSLVSAIVIGSLNAWIWLAKFVGDGLDGLMPVVLLGIIFTSMCYYYFHNREKQAHAERIIEESKRKQAEQEKALILSQLRQMQSQIEPHFLFNTLANISALMEQDSAKARMMLEKLTELLRTSLANSRQSHSSIANEIRLIEAYLAIQKVRLDHRLNFEINIAAELREISIPPMLIQPLVENAIKHGIEPQKQGGTITISVEKYTQDRLIITVQDDGLGLEASSQTKGSGVGLSNIKQRVHALYDSQAKMSIQQPEQGGFKVTIELPMTKEPSAL